jgi:hypothetical protein
MERRIVRVRKKRTAAKLQKKRSRNNLMAGKLPYLQMFPGDVMRRGLFYCSDKAVVLWLKILFILHDSERYGYLLRDGKQITDEQAARRCGVDVESFLALTGELIEFSLLKRTSDDTIFSPDLIHQAEQRTLNAKRQKNFKEKKKQKGNASGNAGSNANGNGAGNALGNGVGNAQVTGESRLYSSSYSTTLSSNEEKSGGKSPPAAAFPPDTQRESGKAYLERKQVEFPRLNVRSVYDDFLSKCGSDRYPNLKNTPRQFDKWLEKEDPLLDIPDDGKFIVPGIGELK